MDALEAIRTRRSLRQLSDKPVPHEIVDAILELAATAPAPHHTRPWRYVIVLPRSRDRLIEAMGTAWRVDLERDGHAASLIERLLRKSRRQIASAPVLLLVCLTNEGLRRWPDDRRARNEWAMAQQSVGAAMQNIMLAAHAMGLSSYWISAPLFAPEACTEALALPDGWVAQALIVLGYGADAAAPKPRPAADLSKLVIER
jgi:coenzyme F420-0:L-glutamate ligase/coenzyme F420-1:gamma-L-glutamate ligase